MSIRNERIKALIEQSGKSYVELEKITGVKKSSLQRYASGTITKIPLDVIEKLSNTFGVSQEYLMGWDEKSKEKPQKSSPNELQLTEGEKDLIELFRMVPKERQQLVTDMIRVALNRKG